MLLLETTKNKTIILSVEVIVIGPFCAFLNFHQCTGTHVTLAQAPWSW